MITAAFYNHESHGKGHHFMCVLVFTVKLSDFFKKRQFVGNFHLIFL